MTEHELFAAALAIGDPAERDAYLSTSCAGDAALRGRVESLLRAHARAGNFLGTPAYAPAGDDTRTGPGADADLPIDFLAPPAAPGSLGRLGHYEVQTVVGRGGMGVVLKAFDANLHRVVAVKVMAPQLAAVATARRRFMREARAAAAVTHEHVVTIHAVEEAKGLPYIVMQYVDGVSLQDRIDRTGPLPLREVLRIGMQAASGLAAAHKQGLVHRDVKPANILLENGVERVKLTDFGLARAADDASLTQAGQVAGTPQYMSPEQAEGKPVDARSDLFSLGSVLYAMCAGGPPFRGGTATAVLRRVVEGSPEPLREVNPEVPDWLAEVVGRLHAKDPAGRFPSATEVTDLLGRHLAHLQHPSHVPARAAPRPEAEVVPVRRRGRWAVAASVLVLLTAGLGLTEAAGVTKVRATVIRIFTPDGTLVVEADDPDVRVTIEGDGGLVITGAGPQEVRVRPGSYKVQATRDGKPVRLDRDLVVVTRDDRQIVKVRVEGDRTATAVAPKADAEAFVVLAGPRGAERKFGTLAAAVASASDGDTIEVRGNGPFYTDPVDLGARRLRICAAAGFAPIIKPSLLAVRSDAPLMTARGGLTLEGLELHHEGVPEKSGERHLIFGNAASLYVSNCKLILNLGKPALSQAVSAYNVTRGEIRNSLIVAPTGGIPIVVGPSPRMQWAVDNCLIVSPGAPALYMTPDQDNSPGMKVRFARNNLVAYGIVTAGCPPSVLADRLRTGDNHVAPALVETEGNVGQLSRVFFLNSVTAESPRGLPVEEQRRFIPRLIRWREQGNLYGLQEDVFLSLHAPPTSLIKGLGEWNAFWGLKDTGSLRGNVVMNGDPIALAAVDPATIAPEDFRLRPDSAGFKAGKGGKDLGADVDLVGPGAAYERWKKTPDYQQWLKDSGQVK